MTYENMYPTVRFFVYFVAVVIIIAVGLAVLLILSRLIDMVFGMIHRRLNITYAPYAALTKPELIFFYLGFVLLACYLFIHKADLAASILSVSQ